MHYQHNKEREHKQTLMEVLGHILKCFKTINFHFRNCKIIYGIGSDKHHYTTVLTRMSHQSAWYKKGKITFEFFIQKLKFLFNILYLQLKSICPFRVKTIKEQKRASK